MVKSQPPRLGISGLPRILDGTKMPRMSKYLAELLGTFALVFAGTGAIVMDTASQGGVTHVGVALTFGLVVLAMIQTFGDVSGAHLNPAVTLGLAVARRFSWREVAPYVGSQLVGAMLASGVLKLLFPADLTLGATLPRGSETQSLVLEFILTWLLMTVILHVTAKGREQGIGAVLAIAGTVGLEAMFAGPICGASMNPARSLAPALMSGTLEHGWIYLIGPVAGALAACVTCRWVRPEGCCGSGCGA